MAATNTAAIGSHFLGTRGADPIPESGKIQARFSFGNKKFKSPEWVDGSTVVGAIAVEASTGGAWPDAGEILPSSSRTPRAARSSLNVKPARCARLNQEVDEVGIMCEPCNGKGWLICDFCKGQKTNVKADNKRIYRRCPSCRAVGYVLCSKCKVFKCVTFPNYDDGQELNL